MHSYNPPPDAQTNMYDNKETQYFYETHDVLSVISS